MKTQNSFNPATLLNAFSSADGESVRDRMIIAIDTVQPTIKDLHRSLEMTYPKGQNKFLYDQPALKHYHLESKKQKFLALALSILVKEPYRLSNNWLLKVENAKSVQLIKNDIFETELPDDFE